MKAVDDYATMLRASVATAGNDHRLGANEAPPAVVSIFLGKQLEDVLTALKEGKTQVDENLNKISVGVEALPVIKRDKTDRNRTSPFAFTGNRFEFRMPGSSQAIADVNTAINTAVAAVLSGVADRLDKGEAVMDIVVDIIKKHDRIVFDGNGYSDEWLEEAKRRGLPNLKSTVDAVPELISKENVKAFSEMGVLTEVEAHSRCEILLEEYSKTINIEMLTALEMAKQEILPACIKYTNKLAKGIVTKESIGIKVPSEKKMVSNLAKETENLLKKIEKLEKIKEKIPQDDALKTAKYYQDEVLLAMGELRDVADKLETMMAKDFWPMPTYTDLLYNV